MKKNENQPAEMQVYGTYETQIGWFKNHWRSALPLFQQLVDELALIGLQPTAAMVDDLISSNGKNTSQVLLEQARIEAAKTGISNPAIIKTLIGEPAARLEPSLIIARSIMSAFTSSMLTPLMKPAIHWQHITIDKGVVSISDEKINQLTAQFFTVYVATDCQKKIFELTESCLPALNEIFRETRKFNILVKFADLFEFDKETDGYRFKTSTMDFFGKVSGQ